ncbi:MAG: DUF924 family protein [Rubrobacteraceae bacterium]
MERPRDVHRVLDFWFGREDDEDYGKFREAWFQKNDDFDREVISRFSDLYEDAASGKLDSWKDDSKSALALIIVLDQCPRNMFRGDPQSWATGNKALETAKHAVEHAFDRELPPFQRSFVYMPFMHSENLDDQKRCVELFEAMGEDGESNVEYAVGHMKIIEKFGRFPHRNEVLGRQTTPEEAEFLTQPGSSF